MWPGDQTQPESLWLLPSVTVGQLDIPVSRGNPTVNLPLIYEDNFTVPVEIQAATQGQTDTAAEQRVELFTNAVVASLAADPVVGLGFPNTAGLMWAVVVDVEGPGTVRASNGVQAFATVHISCKSRST